MKLYPKQHKDRGGDYYGGYGEISIGISVVTVEEFDQNFTDPLHHHIEAKEFYIVTQGKLLLEVSGEDVEVDSSSVLMVEPSERHRVKSILQFPATWVTISTPKGSASDKVVT
jgi:mannose-6-phosphate isomerase-like protein (cupin superfamily)